MPTILTSRWTPRVLFIFMMGSLPIQLGAMVENDHFTHGMFAAVSFVSTASYAIVLTIQALIKKGKANAQAEQA